MFIICSGMQVRSYFTQVNEAGFIGYIQLNKEAGISLCRGTVVQAVNMAGWGGRMEATVTIQSTFALGPEDFAIP